MNTAPGFRCEACPLGYTGLPVEGVGVLFAQTNKQVSKYMSPNPWACSGDNLHSNHYSIQICDDVDECKGPDNGGCTANSLCHNSVVRLLSSAHLPLVFLSDGFPTHAPPPPFIHRVLTTAAAVRPASREIK